MGVVKAPARTYTDWIEMLGYPWCKYLHEAVMWPIHGQYRCRTCLRQHPVPWEERKQSFSQRHSARVHPEAHPQLSEGGSIYVRQS
jgi:hypothetical protein